jgi:hypothetical protein
VDAMPMLSTYFHALSEVMAAESRLLAQVYSSHHGKLGENREAVLQRFFSTYLPQRFGVGTGFALLGAEQVSTQQDVVIYDRLNNPVLFPESAAPLFPPSALVPVDAQLPVGRGSPLLLDRARTLLGTGRGGPSSDDICVPRLTHIRQRRARQTWCRIVSTHSWVHLGGTAARTPRAVTGALTSREMFCGNRRRSLRRSARTGLGSCSRSGTLPAPRSDRPCNPWSREVPERAELEHRQATGSGSAEPDPVARTP